MIKTITWKDVPSSSYSFNYPHLFITEREIVVGITNTAVESSPASIVLYPLTITLGIVIQAVVIISWPILLFIVDPIIFFIWLIFGMCCHMFKLISLKGVWNTWFQVWRVGADKDIERLMTIVDIDVALLNVSLSHLFYYETFPHIVVQLVNNTLSQGWNALSIISLILSGLSAINGAWKFLFWKFIAKREMQTDFKDIPVDGLLISRGPPG